MEVKVDSSISVLNLKKKTICSTVLVEAGHAVWAPLLTGGREGTKKLIFHFLSLSKLVKMDVILLCQNQVCCSVYNYV
jgi:hypothetical protein